MKTSIFRNLLVSTTLICSVSAYAFTENESIKICGTIYRGQSATQSSSDSGVRIKKTSFEGVIIYNILIIPTTREVADVLKKVTWPNDSYIGCVLGNKLPEPGYEGETFEASRIELLGQN